MLSYHYKAFDSTGKTVHGTIDAGDRRQAVNKLRAQQLKPISVKEANANSGSSAETGKSKDSAKKGFDFSLSFRRKESFDGGGKTALAFLEKLHQLHSNGLPIGDAVKILSQRLSDPQLKALANRLWKDLSEGFTLSTAMQQCPGIFEPTITHLVEAGEATGNVAPVLINVIELLKARAALRRQILGSLAYPAFLCLVALGVIALFLFFLLPRIQGMLASMGGEMSFSAKLLVGISDFAIFQAPFVLLAIAVGVIIFWRWRKSEKGRIASDRWALRLPIVRRIAKDTDLCRMSNLMGTLLGSGVDTTDTMKLTEKVLKNKILAKRFATSRVQINDGASVSAAFKRNKLLADIDIDILTVGENTGNLVSSFQEIYRTHQASLARTLTLLTTMISSGALLFTFLLVGVLTLGIISSIMQLSQSMLN